MSTPDLFPDADMAMDSPRLAWKKKHGVSVSHCADEEHPWSAWFASNTHADNRDGVPINPDLCGFGETEEDALRDLAVRNDTPLWNEEVKS